jgi:hypothetical protein
MRRLKRYGRGSLIFPATIGNGIRHMFAVGTSMGTPYRQGRSWEWRRSFMGDHIA